MPLNIDFVQILLHMLNLVILVGGLSFLLYKPVVRFMDRRRAYFADMEAKNQADAEENRRLHEAYEQNMRQAEDALAEKERQCEKEMATMSASLIQEAKDKAAEIIHTAEQEAEQRKAHILESAQTEIGELVVAATQKLLSDTVTPERNRTLYDEFLRVAESKVADERAEGRP